jgi:DNA-binding NtrC family response regulator
VKPEAKVKIFYADDDEDDRFLFEAAIREINIPVDLTCFSGGHSMERMLAENKYDCELVFLDLNMPGKSGLETLDSLQIAIKMNMLKVVIFSTSADKNLVQKTHNQNAVLFVQKPKSFNLLVTTLQKIIDTRDSLQIPVTFEKFQHYLNDAKTLHGFKY